MLTAAATAKVQLLYVLVMSSPKKGRRVEWQSFVAVNAALASVGALAEEVLMRRQTWPTVAAEW
jgi:hypothetical protein